MLGWAFPGLWLDAQNLLHTCCGVVWWPGLTWRRPLQRQVQDLIPISWPLIGWHKICDTHLLRCGLVARWRHYTRGYWGLHGKILHSGRTVSNICDYNNCQAIVWIKNLYLQANEKIKSMRGEAIICSNAHWLVDRRLANNSTAQWCHCIVYDVTHTEPGINAGSRLSWPLTTANRRSLGILAFPLVRAVLL